MRYGITIKELKQELDKLEENMEVWVEFAGTITRPCVKVIAASIEYKPVGNRMKDVVILGGPNNQIISCT